MNELLMVLGVAGMFLLRIGLPILVLIGLGIIIERWQHKKEAEMEALKKQYEEMVASQQAKDIEGHNSNLADAENGAH